MNLVCVCKSKVRGLKRVEARGVCTSGRAGTHAPATKGTCGRGGGLCGGGEAGPDWEPRRAWAQGRGVGAWFDVCAVVAGRRLEQHGTGGVGPRLGA